MLKVHISIRLTLKGGTVYEAQFREAEKGSILNQLFEVVIISAMSSTTVTVRIFPETHHEKGRHLRVSIYSTWHFKSIIM